MEYGCCRPERASAIGARVLDLSSICMTEVCQVVLFTFWTVVCYGGLTPSSWLHPSEAKVSTAYPAPDCYPSHVALGIGPLV